LDPWSLRCACHLAVYQVDFQNVGVRGCHRWIQQVDCRRAISESDGWIKLHACSLRLPPLQLAELIFKLLVFAPALGAVYQVNFEKCCCVLLCAPATGAVKRIDCQIPGLCACQLCSLPE